MAAAIGPSDAGSSAPHKTRLPGIVAEPDPTLKEPLTPPIEVTDPSVPMESYVEAAKILKRCNQLAMYSDRDDGIERVHLSKEHKVVNTLVGTWMREIGMKVWQDAAGNECARFEGRKPGLPAVLLGSHLDTVPGAGRYDGVLGVMLAIQTASRFAERMHDMPFALEIIAFSDEEGTRFGTALFGSKAASGTLDDSWWTTQDARGISLEDAFRNFGLDPEHVAAAARRPEDLICYLEAHIEQRPFLDQSDRSLAVVTGIAGARRLVFRLEGESRHAGTPFDMRKDALLVAAEAIVRINGLAESRGDSVTIGHIQVYPDAVNVVPGIAEFTVDYRSSTDVARDAGVEAAITLCRELCHERGLLDFQARETHTAHTVGAAKALRAAVAEGISSTGDDAPMELFSVAGHDAMAMAEITEMAMLFIRCKEGISHNPLESVRMVDVAKALDAFTATVTTLALKAA